VTLVANRIEKRGDVETPRIAWLFGLAAWAIPGAGHLLQRRWVRGVLLGGAVWVMFLLGLWLGGHLYTVTGKEQGFGVLLQLLPMIADLGSGLLYVVCWLANVGFAENAELMTYEYGNTFFLVAGLLNYLAMLDAFDIAAGRKQ
jgi:hypothetical protein